MAYVPTDTLFAVGGSPEAPLDPADTPGYPAGTKAYGFTEVLTSARINRLPYALSLNIDDVNTRFEAHVIQNAAEHLALQNADDALSLRIDPFETDGLDAAYRLGTVNTAGGGRLITADGGAVEISTTNTSMFEDDVTNSALRLRSDQSSLLNGGALPLDIITSRFTTAGGAYAAFIHREIYEGSGATSIPAGVGAVLNPNGISPNVIRIPSGGVTGYPNSELHVGDFVEVTGGTNPGTFVVISVNNNIEFSVYSLSFTVPSFVADEYVNITVYRPRVTAGGLASLSLDHSASQADSLLSIRTTTGIEAISVFEGSGTGVLGDKIFSVTDTGAVTAAGAVTAGDDIDSGGVITSVGDIVAGGDSKGDRFIHNSPRELIDRPLLTHPDYYLPTGTYAPVDFTPDTYGWKVARQTGYAFNAAAFRFHFNLNIPDGATITSLVLAAYQEQSDISPTILTTAVLTKSGNIDGFPLHDELLAETGRTTLGTQTVDMTLITGTKKAVVINGMSGVHSRSNYYILSILVNGLGTDDLMVFEHPQVTYEYTLVS